MRSYNAFRMALISCGLLFVLGGAECAKDPTKAEWQPAVVVNDRTTVDIKFTGTEVRTLDNHSYIPIKTKDTWTKKDDGAAIVLSTLREFGRYHPELEVLSFNVREYHGGNISTTHIHGIWVTHRSRATTMPLTEAKNSK